ncbi:MAG: 30S ribosomal protein S3 [Candidatus Diapherotrites archaeon]|nr:30S ribosomal protein S3 [Candidatus Diapherotrites archaeon]
MIERHFVKQGLKKVQLEQFLRKELDKAGFTELDIVKTPMVTRIVVNVAKPGLAIGKGGQNIRSLTDEIGRRFQIDNPQLEIKDIPQPELDAKAVIDKMKGLIARGFSWRSIAYRTVNDIERAGALGVELVLMGNLAGKGERKRKVRIAKGYMKKVGEQAKLVEFAIGTAYFKLGSIGLRLRIVRPGTVFPDHLDLKAFLEARKAGVEAATEGPVEVKAAAPGAGESVETPSKTMEEKQGAEEKPKKESKPRGRKKAKQPSTLKDEDVKEAPASPEKTPAPVQEKNVEIVKNVQGGNAV